MSTPTDPTAVTLPADMDLSTPDTQLAVYQFCENRAGRLEQRGWGRAFRVVGDETAPTDAELTDRAAEAVLADMRLSTPDTQRAVDQAYRACEGRPWLYQRGWNRAYRAMGETPTELDLALARPA